MSAMRLQRVQSTDTGTSTSSPAGASGGEQARPSSVAPAPSLSHERPGTSSELLDGTPKGEELPATSAECGATELMDVCEGEELTDECVDEKVAETEVKLEDAKPSSDSEKGTSEKPRCLTRDMPSIVLQGTGEADEDVHEENLSEPPSSPRSPSKLQPLKLRPPSSRSEAGSVTEGDDGKGARAAARGGSTPARKSPVTVQEWVDSLPITLSRSEEEIEEQPVEDGEEALDLGLGAEAGLLYNGSSPITVVSPQQLRPGPSIDDKLLRRDGLARESSLQSDVTSHGSHGSSVESYLESRKPDPEEVLLNLGFGGPVSSLDSEVTRIPRRFLQPSKVKGVAIRDFIRHQQELIENFETGFCGYRGLTGPSYSMPSVIVSKIREKLREYERESVHSSATSEYDGLVTSPPSDLGRRFSHHSHRHMLKRGSAATTSSSSPIPRQTSSLSVLNADNRRFLENQGSKSPEVPRKRMIIGQQSFTVGRDGDLIEMETTASGIEDTSNVSRSLPPLKPLVHKDSVLSSATDMSLTSVDSDSDTDDKSASYELRCIRLPNSPIISASTGPLQSSTPYSNCHSKSTNISSSSDQESDVSGIGKMPARPSGIGKRMSSTSLSSWESDTNTSPNGTSSSDNPFGKGRFAGSECETKEEHKHKVGYSLFSSSRLRYESIEEDVEMKTDGGMSKESNNVHHSSSEDSKCQEAFSKEGIRESDDSVFINSVPAYPSNKVPTNDDILTSQGRRGSLKRQQNFAEEEALDILSGSVKPVLMTVETNANLANKMNCEDVPSPSKLQVKDKTCTETECIPNVVVNTIESCTNQEATQNLHKENNMAKLRSIERTNTSENDIEEFNSAKPTSSSSEMKCTPTEENPISREISLECLEVIKEIRGDSFEMEEICNLEEERGTQSLSRARSDSSGFLDGDAEKTPSDKSDSKASGQRKLYNDEKHSGVLEDNTHADGFKNVATRLRGGSTGTVVDDREGNSEITVMNALTKRLSLPVVCVLDEKGGVLISRSNSLNSISSENSNSSGGGSVDLYQSHKRHRRRIHSAPDALALASSCSSVSNMFSSCSDESVIHVSLQEQRTSNHLMTSDANVSFRRNKDLQELLEELAGRGVNFSQDFSSSSLSSQPNNQPLPLQADAVRAALETYNSQLVEGVSSLQSHSELMECGLEAQCELQIVQDIREQIASELRRVAALLEEQPGPRAVAITRQMTILLREQTRLCQQLEALSRCTVDSPLLNNINAAMSVPTAAPPTAPCCNSEKVLGAVHEENRRLECMVQRNSQELTEIRLLLEELVSKRN